MPEFEIQDFAVPAPAQRYLRATVAADLIRKMVFIGGRARWARRRSRDRCCRGKIAN